MHCRRKYVQAEKRPEPSLWSVVRKINYPEPSCDELAIKSGNTEDYDMLCSH
jgi:hypothetical protein